MLLRMQKNDIVKKLGIKDKKLQAGNVEIDYKEVGRGPLIILIHSWNNDWYGFLPLLPYLTKNFRVIALNLPGYAESTKLKEKYSIPVMADHVVDFIDALEQKPKILSGLSMGAAIVLDIGYRHPEKTESIVPMGLPIRTYKGLVPNVYKGYMHFWNMSLPTRVIGKRLVSNYYYGHLTAKYLNMYKYDKKLVDKYGLYGRDKILGKTLFNMSVSMIAYPAGDHLSKLTIPTKLIFGAQDKLVDLQWAQSLAKEKKNVEVDLISDAGHVVCLEKPEETAGSITSFAKKQKFIYLV